ncbi:MAG: serine/threonine protein kinase [bacterium]|nr:serine/threonine protein kinase [bacterium]
MDIEREREIHRIFREALKKPQEERDEFIKKECAGDPELYNEVTACLSTVEEAEDHTFLLSPIPGGIKQLLEQDQKSRFRRLGDYEILSVLGEGGMGTVYLARQEYPIERKVALKLIKPGMDSDFSGKRFEIEQQALAKMQHPNIAQVYGSGTGENGEAYFVMEYIEEGTPITGYCRTGNLTVQQRLRLFLNVCDAVQYAHQQGIIHRDIKPSNILVAPHTGGGNVKIIDFGIAKAIEGNEPSLSPGTKPPANSFSTQTGVTVGSPGYMSPEQLDVPSEVDTRTDIYSLGVVLYELLTGTLPAEEPGAAPLDLNIKGGSHPDLGWIIHKALQNDKDKRYATAAQLARDIRRHLGNRPVEAVPHGFLYRAGKFAKRHKWGVSVSVILFLAVILGVIGTVSGMIRAEEEARKAGTTIEVLQEFLTSADLEANGPDVKLMELLVSFSSRMENGDMKHLNPEIAATLHYTFGQMYLGLGVYEKANFHAGKAYDIRDRYIDPHHPQTLGALDFKGEVLWHSGKKEEGETLIRQALEKGSRILGENHPDTLRSRGNMVMVLMEQNRIPQAERLTRQNLDAYLQLRGEEHPDSLDTMANLSTILETRLQFKEAEELLRRVVKIRKRAFGPKYFPTVMATNQLALLLAQQGKIREAAELCQQELLRCQKEFGPLHSAAAVTLESLAAIRMEQGKPAEAESLLRQALDIYKQRLGEEHANTMAADEKLADVLLQQGKEIQAQALLKSLLEKLHLLYGPHHPDSQRISERIASSQSVTPTAD